MTDDAVAPVIAVMLILAAIVTFLSIWNAVYVPSMKQSTEVSHLQTVESAFLHISSDIDRAVSTRQDDLTLSEPVPLGGGEFFFNTLRSSGSLAVRNESEPVYYLTHYDANNRVMGEMDGTLVTISYEPQGNFWQDQGYRWQYGYLNVTKHRTLRSPLRYYNMTDVTNDFRDAGSLAVFAGSFVAVEYTINRTPVQNTTPDLINNRFTFTPPAGTCSGIDLSAVNLSASPNHRFVSSNGFGTLQVSTNVTAVPYYGVSNITFYAGGNPFGNATFRNWNASFSKLAAACENNIAYRPEYSGNDFSVYSIRKDVSPVNVTLSVVTIEISAY
ncbi:hypothetical protein [Methanoregula sp.]|uniref:hypothetical protein n=1 Tax=Methanoregula sp. TaxID=2052170 RepID=UPI003567FF5F